MNEEGESAAAPGSMLIYRDASTTLQARLDGNTVWLSQRQIAGLYQTTPQNVTQHLAHIYEEVNWTSPQPVRTTYKFKRKALGASSAPFATMILL